MAALEIALCFTAGLFLLILTALLFRLSFKGIARLLLNAAFGGAVLLALSMLSLFDLPLNPVNALVVGYLGVPGLIALLIIRAL